MSDPEMEYEEYGKIDDHLSDPNLEIDLKKGKNDDDESEGSVGEEWLKEQKGYEEDLKNEKERDQPESVKIWAIEQAKRIEVKDLKEENDIKKLKENARHELEEFYVKYNVDLTKRMDERRKENFTEEEGGDGETNHWMRISNLLDLSAKPNLNGRKDVSRMRSVILQLKNNEKI